jgi:hypothetical protein
MGYLWGTSHTNFDKTIDAQFDSLAVRRKKNKNDKKSVSFNFKLFAICGKFTRALLAHQIFLQWIFVLISNRTWGQILLYQPNMVD